MRGFKGKNVNKHRDKERDKNKSDTEAITNPLR